MESIVGKVAKDISNYTFKDMAVGESFETKGIFAGVDETTLQWRLVETNFSKTDLVFKVTYHGIHLGDFKIKPSDNFRVTAL